MALKTITVIVNADGTVTTDYSNFTGTDCLAAGRQLHVLLAQFGVQVAQTDMIPKPELLAALGEQQAILGANQDMEMEK